MSCDSRQAGATDENVMEVTEEMIAAGLSAYCSIDLRVGDEEARVIAIYEAMARIAPAARP